LPPIGVITASGAVIAGLCADEWAHSGTQCRYEQQKAFKFA
jgi:hypothetical protein